MSNWNEKIRKEEELASQRAREVQLSRQEEEEKRNANVRHVFEIIERLDVQGKLEEIRRDVWKEGQLDEFEQEETDSDRRFRYIRKGVSLVYRWKTPGQSEHEVVGHKKKFELWEHEYHSRLTQGGDSITEEIGKRFNPHVKSVPEYAYPVYRMMDKSESLSVFIELKLKDVWGSDGMESIKLVVNSGSCSIFLASGPLFEFAEDAEEKAANFLDKALLDDCINRKKYHKLPADIEEQVKKRIEEIPPSQLKYE